MITNGEQEIDKVLCILPDGSGGTPCGACRELMVQLMPNGRYKDIEIIAPLHKSGKDRHCIGSSARCTRCRG